MRSPHTTGVSIKSAEEIAKMRVAGRLASEMLDYLTPHVKVGISTGELDRIAHDYQVNVQHVVPATLNYAPPGHQPYPSQQQRRRFIRSTISALSNQYTSNPWDIVTRIECIPMPANVGFEPAGEIPWAIWGRRAHVTQISGPLSGRNVHAAAECNSQVRVRNCTSMARYSGDSKS